MNECVVFYVPSNTRDVKNKVQIFKVRKNIPIRFADIQHSFSTLNYHSDSKKTPNWLPGMHGLYIRAGVTPRSLMIQQDRPVHQSVSELPVTSTLIHQRSPMPSMSTTSLAWVQGLSLNIKLYSLLLYLSVNATLLQAQAVYVLSVWSMNGIVVHHQSVQSVWDWDLIPTSDFRSIHK